jgi:hypothetical protein
MARSITISIELEHIACAACGIVFAFDSDLMGRRRNDHQVFYCPSGHNNYFPGESDVERLARELKEAQLEIKRAEYRAQTAQLERKDAQQQLRATKGQVTKLKKRIANGVCPCCKRSFPNLHNHMTTKHPEYAIEEPRQ